MNRQTSRVAIVTGAGQGIGQEIAVRLAARGHDLVLLDLQPCEATLQRVQDSGQRAISLICDVASESDWQRVQVALGERFGRADVLVNNAGIYPYASIDTLEPALFRKVMAINVEGPFLGTRCVLPLMQEQQWGRIINISSNSITTCATGLSHYIASKMGVIGLTRGLANDLAPHGITVNAVAPAMTRTPGTDSTCAELIERVWNQQAIKRFAEPDDIVGPVLFLASDEAAFMTGQTLAVDGGMMKL
jgi:NAD(P)-dependent dehydrogenase (short-subunit alcohol dehydrogenase family)